MFKSPYVKFGGDMKNVVTLSIFLVIVFAGCSSSTNVTKTQFAINPTSLDFENVVITESKFGSFTVSNKGDESFEITLIEISGSNSTDFIITSPSVMPSETSPIVVDSGTDLIITVEFLSQSEVGVKKATFKINYSTSSIPYTGNLTGKTIIKPTCEEDWGISWGSNENDTIEGIASDSYGNVYVVGSFYNTIDLNPYDDNNSTTSADVDDHASKGDLDGFLSKFDKYGNYLWGTTWGSTQADRARGVVVDSDNNVYVAGDFQLTVDFDPSSTVSHNLSSINDDQDCYLLKLDSSGNFKWVRSWGGNQADWVYNCEIDSKNNILIVGKFRKTCDFDPGMGISSWTSNGEGDCYVLKLNSNGEFVWSVAWGGDSPDHATCVAVDSQDNVIVGGFYQQTVNFSYYTGTVNHTSKGSLDCYVMKILVNGTFSWVNTWGSTESDRTNGVACDSQGNVYAVGQFENTCDFDPSSGTNQYASAGGNDGFISKFDGSGNYEYTYFVSSDSGDIAAHVCCDYLDNVYITGSFKGSWDFNPADDSNPNTTSDENIFSAYNGADCFLAVYDNVGNYKNTKIFGSSGAEVGLYVYKTPYNEIILGGYFANKIDLNPEDDNNSATSSDVDEHYSVGGNDCFLIKLK